MNFDFLPLTLNSDITDFKGSIEYLGTDNGVDLYRAEKELKKPILNIQVFNCNLYFFEGSLITVYIHLEVIPENFRQVRQILEKNIKHEGKAFKTTSGVVCGWHNKHQFLALVNDRTNARLYLYYSLNEFSIYDNYIRDRPL